MKGKSYQQVLGKILIAFLTLEVCGCKAQPPDGMVSVDDIVKYYFHLFYPIKIICGFLLVVHNISVSIRTIKRILRRLGLRRNMAECESDVLISHIIRLHEHGYANLGYNSMWKLLNIRYRLRVTQKTVHEALRLIDPLGVEMRSRHRLRRRMYANKGPNFLIHIDGYDKLKPYGVAIHGAIDGYSRKILWLHAGPTNNNPRVIGAYYMNHLRTSKRVPRMIRSDRGTENVNVKKIQTFFRSDHQDRMSGENSYQYGRSTSNQRIEMLWSFLSKHFTQFWRNFFSDFINFHQIDDSNIYNIECIRYCFLPVIQQNFDSFTELWNNHRIRSQRHCEISPGIPDVLYYLPEIFQTKDYSFEIMYDDNSIVQISNVLNESLLFRGCQEEFIQIIELITQQQRADISVSKNVNEAASLYLALLPPTSMQ